MTINDRNDDVVHLSVARNEMRLIDVALSSHRNIIEVEHRLGMISRVEYEERIRALVKVAAMVRTAAGIG